MKIISIFCCAGYHLPEILFKVQKVAILQDCEDKLVVPWLVNCALLRPSRQRRLARVTRPVAFDVAFVE